jgi:hypothetical protein
MSTFDDFLANVANGSRDLARLSVQGFLTQAEDDLQDFLTRSRADLELWTEQLARGDLSKDEFSDLAAGLKDLAVMQALTKAGVAAANIQRLRDALIDLVIKSAFKAFLP